MEDLALLWDMDRMELELSRGVMEVTSGPQHTSSWSGVEPVSGNVAGDEITKIKRTQNVHGDVLSSNAGNKMADTVFTLGSTEPENTSSILKNTSDKLPVPEAPCYWKATWLRLHQMRSTTELCDITLMSADGATFPAHSAVLAASSETFHGHCLSRGATAGRSLLKVKDSMLLVEGVSGAALKTTLDFVYGIPPRDSHEVSGLLKGAEVLGIPGAVAYCKQRRDKTKARPPSCRQVLEQDGRVTTDSSTKESKVKGQLSEDDKTRKAVTLDQVVPGLVAPTCDLTPSPTVPSPGSHGDGAGNHKFILDLSITDLEYTMKCPHLKSLDQEDQGKSTEHDTNHQMPFEATEAQDQQTLCLAGKQQVMCLSSEPLSGDSFPSDTDAVNSKRRAPKRNSNSEIIVKELGAGSTEDLSLSTPPLSSVTEDDKSNGCLQLMEETPNAPKATDVRPGTSKAQEKRSAADALCLLVKVDDHKPAAEPSLLCGIRVANVPATQDSSMCQAHGENVERIEPRGAKRPSDPEGHQSEPAPGSSGLTKDHTAKSCRVDLADVNTAQDREIDIIELSCPFSKQTISDITKVVEKTGPDINGESGSKDKAGSHMDDMMQCPFLKSLSDDLADGSDLPDVQLPGKMECMSTESCQSEDMCTGLSQSQYMSTGQPERKQSESSKSSFSEGKINETLCMLPDNTVQNLPGGNKALCQVSVKQEPDWPTNSQDLSMAMQCKGQRFINPSSQTRASDPCKKFHPDCFENRQIAGDANHVQYSGSQNNMGMHDHEQMNSCQGLMSGQTNICTDPQTTYAMATVNPQHHNQVRALPPAYPSIVVTGAQSPSYAGFPSCELQRGPTYGHQGAPYYDSDPLFVSTNQQAHGTMLSPPHPAEDMYYQANQSRSSPRSMNNSPQARAFGQPVSYTCQPQSAPIGTVELSKGYGSNQQTSCGPQPSCITSKTLTDFVRDIYSDVSDQEDWSEPTAKRARAAQRYTQQAVGGDMSGRMASVINADLLAKVKVNQKHEYVCLMEGCSYSNKCADYLQSHMYRKHGLGLPDKACNMCTKAFFSDSQLKGHTKRAHRDVLQTPSEPVECQDCKQVFANHQRLQIHMLKAHAKGRLFTCEECSFRSPRKKDVQAHMVSQHGRIPNGVQVYTCPNCDYKCTDKSRAEEHQAMHSGQPKFVCTICSKAYTSRRGMRTHLQYHSSDRPHQCHTCKASFKVRSKLRDHIKLIHTHVGEKPYECGYCGHKTALRGNCNQHIRKHHPGVDLKVVDHKAGQRQPSRTYDYVGLVGAGIQECGDVRKHRWSPPSV